MWDINTPSNNPNPELEKMINNLYKKFKDNRLNLEIKKNWIKHLLPEKTLKNLNDEIPNFKKYIDALKKDNIVIVMMWEKWLPEKFVDRRFTAIVRFIKWVSNKKFIIVNEENNARVAGLLEEAWHLLNPKWSVKKWEIIENKYDLINYIKVELESAIFWNSVAEIIFDVKRDFKEILNKVIDVELMPHYKWKKEELLNIIFKEYKSKNLEEVIDKIKQKKQ